jgi:hypothetical protein
MIRAPLHRLELCSPAPEADTLSTELQGRVRRFYHTVGANRFVHHSLIHAELKGSHGIFHALAWGASRISSARKFSMIFVFPPSSPSLASCSFLWASSPQT